MVAAATFAGGLVLLLGAGHLVVEQASTLGTRFGLSPMVIGLTIVAAGTSAPELAVVGQAIAAEDTELAVGSIIGSNIANVLLVLGIAATLGAIHVASRVVRFDIPVMIGASALFLVFALDGTLGRADSAVLFSCLIIFVSWTLLATRSSPEERDAPDTRATSDEPSTSIVRLLALLLIGVGGLAVAARFVVSGAEEIAAHIAYLIFLILDGTGHRATEPLDLVMGAFVFPLTAITTAIVIHRQHLHNRSQSRQRVDLNTHIG